jgi:hypothetical protein
LYDDAGNALDAGKQSAVKACSVHGGMIAALAAYLSERLQTLSTFCVICDKGHLFASNAAVPVVCERDLCVFSYKEMGVMTGVTDSYATQVHTARIAFMDY